MFTERQNTSRWQSLLIFFAIVAFALAVRGYFLLKTSSVDLYTPWYREGGDTEDYNTIARSLSAGGGFALNGIPTASRPPLYPVFLGILYRVFGRENFLAARMAQILLTLASLFFFWRIGRLLGSGATGLIAGLALAIHPKLIIYDLSLLTETLFLFLMAALSYASVRFNQSGSQRTLIGAWALLALASLTRPSAITFAVFLAFWIWYRASWSIAKTLRLLIPGMFVFLAILTPWTIRNYKIFNVFVPISNVGGGAFGEALDRTVLEPLGISNRDVLSQYVKLPEVEFAQAGYRLFLHEVRAHPLFFLEVTWKKLLYWWSPVVKHEQGLVELFLGIANAAALVLGIAGMVSYGRRCGWKIVVFFLLLFLNFTAVHVLTIPYHRYRFPVIDPYVILFASYELVVIYQLMKERYAKKA